MNSSKAEGWARTTEGLVVPLEYARSKGRPVAIDLFSGAGGFSLGTIQAGFHVIAAMDNDPWCAITYMTNLGAYPCHFHFATDEDAERLEQAMHKSLKGREKREGDITVPPVSGSAWISHYPNVPGVQHFFFGDIQNFTGQQILETIGMAPGEVALVMGGPPCQGFSMSGKRNVMDPRNSLVFEFARVALEIEPKFMVMENVVGMLSMMTPQGLPVVDAFCRILEDGGFGTLKALRKTLLTSAGAGAMLRGKPKKKGKTARPSQVSQGQLALIPKRERLFAKDYVLGNEPAAT